MEGAGVSARHSFPDTLCTGGRQPYLLPEGGQEEGEGPVLVQHEQEHRSRALTGLA